MYMYVGTFHTRVLIAGNVEIVKQYALIVNEHKDDGYTKMLLLLLLLLLLLFLTLNPSLQKMSI